MMMMIRVPTMAMVPRVIRTSIDLVGGGRVIYLVISVYVMSSYFSYISFSLF